MLRRSWILCALALNLCAGAASASGFLFGDNGARALSMGGAFTAQADDLSAIQHNPAGLSRLQGFTFLVDGAALNHEVSFFRRDEDGRIPGETVRNEGGLFFLPVVGVGYGRELGGRRFNASVGVYGPPSVGRYTFPEPDYDVVEEDGRESFEANPIKFAPQRYGLIRNDIIILFPSLALAYEVVPEKLSVGASFQYVYSQLMFRQAVTSVLYSPSSQRQEDPAWDSIVEVHQQGDPTFTGILGVMFRPLDNLAVGASYRPPVKISATGTAAIELGENASNFAELTGDQATFSLTLPQELKLGVRYAPLPALGINAEVVYQGWQSVGEFVLTPVDIEIAQAGAEPEPLDPIHIPKKWHHTFAGRLGAEYRFPFGLTARAGVMVEQGATPIEYFHIDFAHPTRAFVTAGLEYAVGPVNLQQAEGGAFVFGPLSVVLAGAYTPTQTFDITTSEVRQANTDPGVEGAVIGNGNYSTGGWIASLGIRGSFGGEAKAGP